MISHKDPKFVFLHLPKNAGSSVTKALARYIGVQREELRYGQNKFIYARNLHNFISDPESYYIFSVIRNPWDRVVSYFHYLQQIRQPPHNLGKDIKFKDWVKGKGFKGLQTQMSQLSDQFPCNISTSINYVARLESLSEDWSSICQGMGIECELMHDKKSSHRDYTDYYDDETKDIVYRNYKDDVDCLSYYFGDNR
jgi:hypothetical protein